ncbi:hypothetical protein [Hoeflea sp.]|uniref:hypothetical protein n=1 Tax=Hoeflea sp. TaxID=1940281 RepID=UPI003A9395A9
MGIYIVTFTIAQKTTRYGDYNARYNSVIEAVRGTVSAGGTYWDETTSFLLLQSDLDSSKAVAGQIDQNSKFDPADDLLVVINLSKKGYTVLGDYTDKDIDKIMSLR